MREQPATVRKRLVQAVLRGNRIVISAITYQEMRFGATGPKAPPRHAQLVDDFCARLDAVLPWDRAAVDATTEIKSALCYAEVVHRTEEAIRIICTTMPDPVTDPFTDGYLRGILFHWRLMATEAGLPDSRIDEEQIRLQQLIVRSWHGG